MYIRLRCSQEERTCLERDYAQLVARQQVNRNSLGSGYRCVGRNKAARKETTLEHDLASISVRCCHTPLPAIPD